MAARIEVAEEVTPELIEAFVRLTPLLSRSSLPPGEQRLAEIVGSPACTLLMARDTESDCLVGTLTLAVFPTPTGIRAWIEDVIVDESARGHGVGELLTRAGLAHAKKAGARTVDLTSRPSREAANSLYQRVGFAARDTNVYRYDLEAQ